MEARHNHLYRHIKTKGVYQVLHIAHDTESSNEVVIYKSVDLTNQQVWARPREMFEDGRFEEITIKTQAKQVGMNMNTDLQIQFRSVCNAWEQDGPPGYLINPLPVSICYKLLHISWAKVADTLCIKNKQYGNSALDPVRCYSEASPSEQLRVRIDDKISRLTRGHKSTDGEDTLGDLAGYLVLLYISEG